MTWYRGPVLLACVCLLTTLVVALDASKEDCVDNTHRCQKWSCRYGWVRKSCPKKCGSCKPSSTPSLTTHFSSTIITPTTLDSTTEETSTSHSPTTLKTASTHSSTMARTSTAKPSTLESSTPKQELVTTRHGHQTTLKNTACLDTRPECSYYVCKNDLIKEWCPKKCGLCKPTSTVPHSTAPLPSTIKTSTTHDPTTGKISLTHSPTMATILATTRQDLQTTKHYTEPGTTSTEKRLTDKPTTNQTSNEYSNAYASYSKSGLDVAMVIGIAVCCLLLVAFVILLFIIRRRKKRGASLIHEPETIITMQPFSHTRDKSNKNEAARIYEELHGNKGTCLASHKKLTDDSNDNEPFYHVLEGNAPHQSFQNENLYACADYNSHENKAFDLSSQTVPSQSRPEGERYEAITSHKNKKEENNDCEDDFEKPYYHVLEKQNSKNQGVCDEAPLPVYQPLIGVRKDAAGNTVDRSNEYQPLTDVRSKGARMS